MSGRPFVVTQMDVRIGNLISLWRNRLGLSQKDLARMSGVTFQQIQKYESANNRISASRLWKIARALDVPVARFYGDDYTGPTIDRRLSDTIAMLYKMPASQRNYILWIIRLMSDNKCPSPGRDLV